MESSPRGQRLPSRVRNLRPPDRDYQEQNREKYKNTQIKVIFFYGRKNISCDLKIAVLSYKSVMK